MFHHKVKKEKAKQGKGKRGNEREGERTPGKPLTRKCQSLRKEKTIESSDREEQKKKPGKLKESLFLILPLFLSTLPSLVPRDALGVTRWKKQGKNDPKHPKHAERPLMAFKRPADLAKTFQKLPQTPLGRSPNLSKIHLKSQFC